MLIAPTAASVPAVTMAQVNPSSRAPSERRLEARSARDTGARAIGKFVESIPPSDLPRDLLVTFIARLRKNLADSTPGIRAKAIRSLGNLAKYGHLDEEERAKLRELCQLVLGTDETHQWDRAHIVGKQNEEALPYT